MWTDPIIEEVRKAREHIIQECGNDLNSIIKRIKENEKKLREEGWKFVKEKDMDCIKL